MTVYKAARGPGAVLSFYVPDQEILSLIMRKCQEEERSPSQWVYRAIRRYLTNEQNHNGNKERPTASSVVQAPEAVAAVNPGVTQIDSRDT